MTGKHRATAEQVRLIQELRRSNAAQPVPSGKRYKRRPKHLARIDPRTA